MALPDLLIDPCGRAVALRAVRDLMMTGSQESQIRTRTTDSEEEVRFYKGDPVKLESEIRVAESRCAAFNGTDDPHARRALRGGALETGPYFGWPYWS